MDHLNEFLIISNSAARLEALVMDFATNFTSKVFRDDIIEHFNC